MWMSELVYALAFTTITGALLTGIWFLAGRLLERLGFISVAYRLLKTLACFWLLPIAYCVLKWLNLQLYRWQGFLFLPTPFLSMVGKIFFGLWVVAAAFAIVLLLFTGTGSVSAASLSAADVLAAAVRRAGIYLAGSSDQTWEEYITVEGTVSAGRESPWKNSFSWKIPACIQTVGPEIHLKKGQSVSVMLEMDSHGKEVSCGLLQPDGSSRYIIRNGQAEHSFYIEESGVYRFFVLNKGETRVNVHGNYSTR